MAAKRMLAVLTICLVFGLGAVAGCAPQAPTPDATADAGAEASGEESQSGKDREYTEDELAVIAGAEGTTHGDIGEDVFLGKDYIDQLYDRWDMVAEEYSPEVRTLPDGRMVQRTPTEYGLASGAWQTQANTNSYNTYWLDSDNRGCGSCHADLGSVLKNMAFEHTQVWNDDIKSNLTVQECINCHHWAPGYMEKNMEFGTLMHAVHFGARHKVQFAEEYGGNCNSCHNATDNGQGMEMWDLVKYDHLWGVNNIASEDLGDVDFSFEQETTQDNAFSFEWMHAYYDQMRHGAGVLGANLPQSLFDNWEITIDGLVKAPYTATLKELVDEAEKAGVVVEKTSKIVCSWNMVGGGGISNVKITGIPVSWLVEKAGGITDGANGVRAMRADGSSRRSFSLDKLNANEALLVYKINGEPLGAKQGYPCTNWVEGVDAQVFSKQINAYTVADDCPPDFGDSKYCAENYDGSPNGWFDENGVIVNRPNATILDVPEGLVIESGKPFDFHGYVDAYNEHISQMEFSFDGGETWTAFDLADTDPNRVVWWHLQWTPPEQGAYRLTVRATTAEGSESKQTHTVLVNAKDVLPSKEDTVVLETTSLVPPRAAAAGGQN